MHIPEKLSLWDRWFNRYRREVHQRGSATWHRTYDGMKLAGSDFTRRWVEYRVIDRLTGSERLEREYIT